MTIAYDCELKRPGCVLIQAARATLSNELLSRHFDVDTWLLSPTPGTHVYNVTREQLEHLSKITEQARKVSDVVGK